MINIMGFKEFFGLGNKEHFIPLEQRGEVVPEVRDHKPLHMAPSRSVVGIGPKEAIRIGPVYRCVNIISNMVSQMDVKVYRGEKVVKYVPMIVREPIEGESLSSFVQQV